MNTAWMVSVVRLREHAVEYDQWGDRVAGGSEFATPLPDALFAPTGGSEPVQAGAAPVISQASIYWRGHAVDVTASDKLVVEGSTYRVDGKPDVWPKGTSAVLKSVEAKP